MAGFYRERRAKRRHIGWVWGVFVAPESRGQGIGHALLAQLVERAAAQPGVQAIRLSVATSQESARHLYRSLGFEPFGVERRALQVNGGYVDEEHLLLALPDGPPSL